MSEEKKVGIGKEYHTSGLPVTVDTVDTLWEACGTHIACNDMLQEEVSRLRETNTMLRRVNHALRRTLDSLRNQVAAASENDDTFRRYCEGEFDAQVTEPGDAGLAEAGSQVEEAV